MQLTRSKLIGHKDADRFALGYELYPDFNKLLLYNIPFETLIDKLKVVFGGFLIDELTTGNKMIPIVVRNEGTSLYETIANTTLKNELGIDIPLSAVLSFKQVTNLYAITSDKQGEYYGISIDKHSLGLQATEDDVLQSIHSLANVAASFEGSAYENGVLFNQFLMVLVVSLILLYLILAAQFESLVLPFIILIEIAIDISGALLFLMFFGASLNLMSALGIIVMSGIVINDSILKVDTIRQIYNSGTPILAAVYEGGHRRFLPIVMTSLTTILALIPLTFMSGLGVELQLPLALSIIGGLLLGTLVSLFFIPIMFYYIAGKRVKRSGISN